MLSSSSSSAIVKRLSFGLLFSLLLLTSCEKSQKLLLSASLPGSLIDDAAHTMSELLGQKDWNIEAISGGQHDLDKNIENILEGRSNFGLIMNEAALDERNLQVRTVAPLFPLVAMIMYRTDHEVKDLDDLLNNHKVMEIESDFYSEFFRGAGYDVDSLDFSIMRDKDVKTLMQRIVAEKVEVLCVFASIYGPAIEKLSQMGWRFFSLGDIDLFGRGSTVEGYCLKNPQYYPFVIPRGTYGAFPETPVVTIAQDVLMITHQDSDPELVYDLVSDVFNHKQYLSQKNVIFSTLTENFDHGRLIFPLHEGTEEYLARNEPSIFERYAELAGVIFSILVVVVGFLASARRRRKDRIDKYYLLAMEAKSPEELDALEMEVVKLVEQEKVSGDVAYLNFLQIVDMRRRGMGG